MNRIVSPVLLLALGCGVGMVMTFGHQANVTIGAVQLPWGLALALIAVTGLLLGLRLLSGRRTAGWAAAGFIIAVVVLAFPSANGSVLIPANMAGTIWSIAPSVIAIFIVMWPVAGRLPGERVGRLRHVEGTRS